MDKLHDLWLSLSFWIVGEWRYIKKFLPELAYWALFGVLLAVLCFVLGFAAGFFRIG
jgi:hypothetical protein